MTNKQWFQSSLFLLPEHFIHNRKILLLNPVIFKAEKQQNHKIVTQITLTQVIEKKFYCDQQKFL